MDTNTHNLNFLQSAVFIDNSNDEQSSDVEQFSIDTRPFNTLFLDPYKTFLMNIAGRLKGTDGKNRYLDDAFVSSESTMREAIKSYILMNINDTLMSSASGFLDDLVSIFGYKDDEDDDSYDKHYEFEYPYNLLEDNIILEKIYEDFLEVDIKKAIIYFHDHNDDGNITVQCVIGNAIDRLYAYLVRVYFDKIITKTTTFYLGRPEFVKEFYHSFFNKYQQMYTGVHDFNNAYSYISIGLRDLMKPHIEHFKDCLYIIGNTVSSMILGYDVESYEMSYDQFLRSNPFVYEILVETYSNNTDTEEDEEDDVESDN